ncbi:hypothetical protein JCM8547_007148 [Rhodosporidiobolus lusitaniae]
MLRRTLSTVSAAPSYRTTAPADAPPPYPPPDSLPSPAFPSTGKYRVGRFTASFVSSDDLLKHLRLLGAFSQLKKRIVDGPPPAWCDHLSGKERWGVFVQIAVQRFVQWMVPQGGRFDEEVVPPVDVLLVLHAYLLNPGRYHEDMMRGVVRLDLLRDFLLERAVHTIDPATLQQVGIDHDMQTRFEAGSGLASRYDPVENFSQTKGVRIRGPGRAEEIFVPWINKEGTGFAQMGFRLQVPQTTEGSRSPAPPVWTHESLGIWKLARDIAQCKESSIATLAGTILSTFDSPSTPLQSRRARFVRDRVLEQMPVKVMKNTEDLGRMMGWKREGAEVLLKAAVGAKYAKGVNNILASYSRSEPFSPDLAMAVLRQGTFIDKMASLNWLGPDRFQHDVTVLRRSITRYHAFMDLIACSPNMFCVPTLDIDLAWHTHQLSSFYQADSVAYLGRFVDHDDKVEENALACAYDSTAKAWVARYGVPYFSCGCTNPNQAPALARLFGRSGAAVGGSTSTHYPAGTLDSPSSSSAPNSATHASEHNALHLVSHPDAIRLRKARVGAAEARKRKDEAGAAKKGKGQAAQRKGEDGEGWKEHELAFLAPVPLDLNYGSTGYLTPSSGCAAYNGNHASKGGAGACLTTSVGSCAPSFVNARTSCGGGFAVAGSSNANHYYSGGCGGS